MKKFTLLFFSAAIFALGCGGGTQYKNPAEDEGSMEWGPKEIKITVNNMVGKLYSYLKDEWQNPSILQVKKIRNRTSEHIDTSMLANEMVTNLIQKRIQFVDDSLTTDAIAEMEKGMTGLIDPESAIPVGELKSPNLYLSGEITDNVRNIGRKRLQYLVVTIKLINLRTGMLMWQQQQEFLKETNTGGFSF